MPARIPAGNELDETTGLHMTGSVQKIDLASYRLTVSGLVDHPLSLTIDQLRCMPKVTTKAVLNCGEIFTDSGTWSGVPIRYILEQAGVQAAATTVGLKSADGYLLLISMEDARDGQNFLAYEMEGKPLPILHGFPLRAVFPNHAGSRWVKWLVEIIVE
jgi:DMSO/TMAO reductase YedYZ molybdopterin-dependent catalytic subunit